MKFLNNNWIEYPFMVIADQDKMSASKTVPYLYISPSIRGYLRYNAAMNFTIEWFGMYNYTSNLNSNGRGIEMSDMKVFNGHLYCPDEKTGILYRLTDKTAVPWTILSDGDGLSNKSM
jgi:hypothetical protein